MPETPEQKIEILKQKYFMFMYHKDLKKYSLRGKLNSNDLDITDMGEIYYVPLIFEFINDSEYLEGGLSFVSK